MTLPTAPPRRRFHLPPPSPRRHDSRRRIAGLVRRHEEEEKPFEPERAPTWRGSSKDLVANPSGFRTDLRELVEHYYSKLRTPLSADEIIRELAEAFESKDTNDALDLANELLDGHGVEALGPVNQHDGPPYLYINFGDTYDPTLMWSRDDNKVFVAMGGWGDVWSEEGEPNAFDEAWEGHVAGEFRREVKSELENYDTPEAEAEAERFDDLSSEEERQLFDKALRDAQNAQSRGKYPELVQESDGYFVSHLDAVVSAAAELIRSGWEPKQTKNSSERFTIVYRSPGGVWTSGEGDVFDSREEAEDELASLREESRDPHSQFFHYEWAIEDYRRNGARTKASDRIRLSNGDTMTLGEALDQGRLRIEEKPQYGRTRGNSAGRTPHYFARENDGDLTWEIGETLYRARLGKPLGFSSNPGTLAGFEELLKQKINIGDRKIFFQLSTPTSLFINYVNLPQGVGEASGGAESQNNRVMFVVRWKGDDKVSVECAVNALTIRSSSTDAQGVAARFRGKTASEDKIARYLADYINGIASTIEPRFTHTRR